jgi:hypothetical protein
VVRAADVHTGVPSSNPRQGRPLYPQHREHSWDGYVRNIKVIIFLIFINNKRFAKFIYCIRYSADYKSTVKPVNNCFGPKG